MAKNQTFNASDYDSMRTWSSVGGCDIIAVFDGVECGSLQAISVTVSREKQPAYVMGRADPVGFSRGKRGIAGSVVGVAFNQSWLLHTIRGNTNDPSKEDRSVFWASRREYRQFLRLSGRLPGAGDSGQDAMRSLEGGDTAVQFYTGKTRSRAWYADQILPFNIVITGANEYGGGMAKSIVGVEILNEATGVSVDDIMIDESHTYVALAATPWMSLAFTSPRSNKTGNQAVDEILATQGLNQAGALFEAAGS